MSAASDPKGDVLVGAIDKNRRERLAVMVREYKGNRFVDARLQYLDDQGQYKPTGKGVTIKLPDVAAFRDLLAQAHDKAREAGWCDDGT